MKMPGREGARVASSPSQLRLCLLILAGAGTSELLTMLERGHQGVKLSREELDKLACWIDLLVPYCGDYREANAWTAEEMKKHERYAEKRRQMEEAEQQNIDAMLGSKEPARGQGPGGPMMQRRY